MPSNAYFQNYDRASTTIVTVAARSGASYETIALFANETAVLIVLDADARCLAAGRSTGLIEVAHRRLVVTTGIGDLVRAVCARDRIDDVRDVIDGIFWRDCQVERRQGRRVLALVVDRVLFHRGRDLLLITFARCRLRFRTCVNEVRDEDCSQDGDDRDDDHQLDQRESSRILGHEKRLSALCGGRVGR